ncbi:MAG: hypothetical protein V4714_20040 [Bacteroidota bacterium]
MKKIYRNLITPVHSIKRDVKKISSSLIKPFLPSYEVIFTMYHVVPGQAVDRQESKFDFERGAMNEAKAFYNKVITSTDNHRIVPAEVQLKRRKKVVQTHYFGPVQEIQKFMNAR